MHGVSYGSQMSWKKRLLSEDCNKSDPPNMDDRKCHIRACRGVRPPAVMNFRAVLVFLALLIVQAACHPVMSAEKDGAVHDTFKILRGEIRIALGHLADPGLLPSVSCESLNVTELPGNQRPLQDQVPSFRCYTEKLSKRIPELSDTLHSSSRYLFDVEKLQNGRALPQNCSLPNFEQDLDCYVYAKCLLQFMEERFSKLQL